MMAKPKSFREQFTETYRPTRAEKDAKRAKKRAEREKEGPLSQRIMDGIVRWGKRLFYTAFMGMGMYLVIMMFTLMLPVLMATIIGSLGYTLANMAELLLAGFCGLFFTAWLFLISYHIVRYFGRIYMKAMRSTTKQKKE